MHKFRFSSFIFVLLAAPIIILAEVAEIEVNAGELVKNAREHSNQVSFKAERIAKDPDNFRTIIYKRSNSDGSVYTRTEIHSGNGLLSYSVNGPQGDFSVYNGIAIKRNFDIREQNLMEKFEKLYPMPPKVEIKPISSGYVIEDIDEDNYKVNGIMRSRSEIGDEEFNKQREAANKIKEFQKAERAFFAEQAKKKLAGEQRANQFNATVDILEEDGKTYYWIQELKTSDRRDDLHNLKIGKDDNFIYEYYTFSGETGKFLYQNVYRNVEFLSDMPDKLFIPDVNKIIIANSEKEFLKASYDRELNRMPITVNTTTTSNMTKIKTLIKIACVALVILLAVVIIIKKRLLI